MDKTVEMILATMNRIVFFRGTTLVLAQPKDPSLEDEKKFKDLTIIVSTCARLRITTVIQTTTTMLLKKFPFQVDAA